MHEAALAMNIIDTVRQRLAEQGIEGRVERVAVRVGRLTTVVPDNLSFLYGVLSEETPLAGSRLEVTMVPARGTCNGCGIDQEIEIPNFLCHGCGSHDLELSSGRELELDAVEVC